MLYLEKGIQSNQRQLVGFDHRPLRSADGLLKLVPGPLTFLFLHSFEFCHMGWARKDTGGAVRGEDARENVERQSEAMNLKTLLN